MGVYTSDPSEDQRLLGGTMYCSHPKGQPLLVVCYFLSFAFIVAFSILSLIIGAIGDAMMTASLDMRKNHIALKIAWQQKTAKNIIKLLETFPYFNRKGLTHIFLKISLYLFNHILFFSRLFLC